MTEPGPDSSSPSPPEPVATGAYSPAKSTSDLVRVLDQYLAELQAGHAPDKAKLLAEHPHLARALEQCLAGMDFIHQARRPSPETPPQLGDFRILREIGQGGMGVVYEAEQLSLKRKVALKVLRFSVAPDAEAMQRFQREAETVAHLHHTNIVPIFAVGCEQGVHYYAMQFIEGKSLAEVLAESSKKEPISYREVARWGLQAAEALAHAHERGVIHRDIKPSNLLLDQEGVLWLTDFGLAKRAEADTFTLSGLVIGTPRYMSPEQASAVNQPIDHRTDIYSLGATLYELATGKPVFEAATPHAVLAQIQNTEPVGPRQIQKSLPRDLETIILKCLAKEPARRYSTAQALVDDLRAFLEGRPIQARRPSLAERAARWARKRRQSATLSVIAATAGVLLMSGCYFAWQWYTEWRQGRVVLTTDGPGLEAEVLDETGESVRPPFAVSTATQPLALPAGQYRLRLSGKGQMSETYELLVEQGVQTSFDVSSGDRQLWEPMAVSKGYEVVEMDGRADVFLVTDKGLRRMNGATGKEIWTRSMEPADQPALAGIKDFQWGNLYSPGWLWVNDGPTGRPWLVRPPPDLEGNGSRYLIWASWDAPQLVAVSAKDGTIKWVYQSQSPGTGVVCPPLLADVDGDGIPDVIATFGSEKVDSSNDRYRDSREVEFTPHGVEAISGRTGQRIWQYVFSGRTFKKEISLERENRIAPYATSLTWFKETRVVSVVAGETMVTLDLHSGKPVFPPCNLDIVSLNTPQFVDLKSNGQLGVLPVHGERHAMKLTALSLEGTSLWEHNCGRIYPILPSINRPVVGDIDGNGKLALAVPFDNMQTINYGVGVEVLDAATGQSRWRRKLTLWSVAGSRSIGPDLDGDGSREVFTCAVIRPPTRENISKHWLMVAANSGADGHTLWQRLHPLGDYLPGDFDKLGPVRWGPPGTDGHPLLMVTSVKSPPNYGKDVLSFKDPSQQTFLFAAGSGKLEHTWPGILDVNTVDLDGDGIPDLYAVRQESDHAGKLYGLRSGPPERWRRLGTWQPVGLGSLPKELASQVYVAPPLPHGDLDGDGIPDIVKFLRPNFQEVFTPSLQAYSGRDGHRLWKVDLMIDRRKLRSAGKYIWLECRDLDGDGRPEVLFSSWPSVESPRFLAVHSGQTGKVLWTTYLPPLQPKDLAMPPHGGLALSSFQLPALWDVNGDGVLDVLVWVPGTTGYELKALDGMTGRLLWNKTLNGKDGTNEGELVAWFLADLDGKGPLVCVQSHLPKAATSKLFIMDPQSSSSREISLPEIGPLHHHDLAGDGKEMLLYVQKGKVCAIKGEQGKKPEWEWSMHRETGEIMDIQPAHNGHPAIVMVRSADTLYGLDGRNGKQLWERPLPGGARHLLSWDMETPGMFAWPESGHENDGPRLQSLTQGASSSPRNLTLVAVGPDNTAYGLDGATGRIRWRCYGPGRLGVLSPGTDPSGLPSVWFHVSNPDCTVCRQAMPAAPDGRYGPASAPPIVYESVTEDHWQVVPLPWVGKPYLLFPPKWLNTTVVQLDYGPIAKYWLVFGAIFLGMLVFFGWKRPRRIISFFVAYLVIFPLVVAGWELFMPQDRNYLFPEQHFGWDGWYLIWPYTVTCPIGLVAFFLLAILTVIGLYLNLPFFKAKQRR